MKKRIAALFLVLTMLIGVLPFNAAASLLDNTPEYNQEVLSALETLFNSESKAKEYYDVLEKYGLLDEDGNAIESWSVTMNGKEITPDELRDILAGDYDKNQVVWVDGAPVTLEYIHTIITIEDYISALRDTYCYDGEWTAEHEKNFASLKKQIADGGLKLERGVDESRYGIFSGVNHGAVVSFETSDGGDTAEVTAKLTGAANGQVVTFDYRTVCGSAETSGKSGTVTLTADENGKASCTFTVSGAASTENGVYADLPTSYFVVAENLKNAFFAENLSDAITIKLSANPTVGEGCKADKFITSFDLEYELTGDDAHYTVYPLSENQKAALNSGLVNWVHAQTYEGYIREIAEKYEIYFGQLHYGVYASESETVSENPRYSTKLPGIQKLLQGIGYVSSDDELYGYAFSSSTFERFSLEKPMESLVITGGFSGIIGISEPAIFNFHARGTPRIVSVSAQSGTYRVGQDVPVVVRYSTPVVASSALLTVNGRTLSPCETSDAENAASNTLTFLYPVQNTDSTTLSVTYYTAVSPNDWDEDKEVDFTVEGVKLESCPKSLAIETLSCEIDSSVPSSPVLTVKAKVSDNADYATWLLGDIDAFGISASLSAAVSGFSEKIPFSVSGQSITGETITASFPLPVNAESTTYTAEIYLEDELLYGFCANAQQSPPTYVTADDISASLLIKNAKGGIYEYEDPDKPVLYVQDSPNVKACFSLAAGDFAYGDTASVTVYADSGSLVDPNADFAWKSSDASIANISADGKVTPTGKSGSVYFILTALNGNAQGKQVSARTDSVTFGVGLTPFLILPQKNITALSESDVHIYWSSNLADKGDPNVRFTVTVKRGSETVWTTSVSGSGAVIPGEKLTYDYSGNVGNAFKVSVSAVYLGKTYSDSATVTIESKPADITLEPLASYYLLDTCGSVDIAWTIDNFDLWTAEDTDLFRLYITRNNAPVYDTASEPGTTDGNGVYTGSYSLHIPDIKPAVSSGFSCCDTYTVTIQAKNGADSTWSYESYIFYVYDADALKIWIDGKEAGNAYTMSNIPEISKMTQAQILALKRDITLKNVISANYGEYAWKELADKLAWSLSDSSPVKMKYKQGAYYDDIQNYSYTSYRPTSEFMLCGSENGETDITVEHVLTGMQSRLSLNVETLRDKLYLFSCTPAVETTLRYVNGKGEEKAVQSNEWGEAAIYEESGIKGNVYCSSKCDGILYNGTFYENTIKTGEGDASKPELYPCNNLKLRRAAYAYVYLKNPDGTPYTGDIIFRGGVYVNGKYRENALFAFAEDKAVKNSGCANTVVTMGRDGKLTVVMDTSQWDLKNGEVLPTDKVEYKLFLSVAFDTFYYPMLLTIDGAENEDTYVRSGSAIAAFRENNTKTRHPFIISMTETLRNDERGFEKDTDILGFTGTIGISDSVKEIDMHTAVMWWGVADDTDLKNSLKLVTNDLVEVSPNDSTVSNTDYPFTDVVITDYSLTFNADNAKDVLDKKGVKKGLKLRYYKDGENLSGSEDLPFRLINLVGISPADSDNLENMLVGLDSYIAADASEASKVDTSDSWIAWALNNIASDSYTNKNEGLFDLNINATKDPTVFIGYITAGLASMTNTNATGVYADGTSDEKPLYYPGFREIALAFTRDGKKYKKKYGDDFKDALDGKGSWGVDYIVRGYLETLITYDVETDEWNMSVISGGFNVGGGANYTKRFNTTVGPVPVTAEIKVGATAEVSMNAITAQYINLSKTDVVSDTEFLTNLRIFAYLKVFGGLGFDYSVVALKIGLYGQVNFDLNFRWLNRPYLSDNSGDDILLRADMGADTSKANLNGQNIKINGQAGIEFFVKVWIFSYDKVLFPVPFTLLDKDFNDMKKINGLWENNVKNYQKSIEELLGDGSVSVSNINGQAAYSLNLAPTTESFDYLANGVAREWNDATLKNKTFFRPSGAVDGVPSLLESNAYPFASPVLSEDGALMVYLSEDSDPSGMAVRTSFAVRDGGGYDDMGVIAGGGFGDSENTVAGTEDFAVAAWTRVEQDIRKDSGSVVTGEEQIIMLDSSEVYASIRQNGEWNTVRLTDNFSADISPVTAVSGNRAVVAWRSTSTSHVDGNITDFNEKDTILYRVYEDGEWGETQSLYNGTSGNVKGIAASMLSDGTAAVVYTTDTDRNDSTTEDREIVYSVIDTNTRVSRTVRATSDNVLDENPQITAVTFGSGEDAEERFVLGWYSLPAQNDGTNKSDICLLDFGKDGIADGKLPQSISRVTEDGYSGITPNFRFIKNARNISDLSMIWAERLSTIDEDPEKAECGDKDVLNSIKFRVYGENEDMIGITGKLNIAEAEDSTLIDSFDAFADADNSDNITAVMLCTSYGKDGETVEKTGETTGGKTVSYIVPKSVSDLYTVKKSYSDAISVSMVYTDIESLKCGSVVPVYFTVSNDGIDPVTEITAEIGGSETRLSEIELLPGENMRLSVDYRVPDKTVKNEKYTVEAKTKDGKVSCADTACFALSDVEITEAKIVSEVEGTRTVSVKLNNNADAKLKDSGKSVHIDFFTDPTCTSKMSSVDPIVISDALSLGMIDEGGYSIQKIIDIKSYLADAELTEIPENGVDVYIKASVWEDGEEAYDPCESNNMVCVTCENLAIRNGTDVSVTSSILSENGKTQVTVTLRRNKLSQTSTGNVIVTLYDGDGNILEQKQSYDPNAENSGLLTLGGEASETRTFTFDRECASADVTYTDVVLADDSNAALSGLWVSNIPEVSLASFTESETEPGTFIANVVAENIYGSTVWINAETPDAVITLNGEKVNGSVDIRYKTSVNAFDFTVTAKDGKTVRHYILHVQTSSGSENVPHNTRSLSLNSLIGTNFYLDLDAYKLSSPRVMVLYNRNNTTYDRDFVKAEFVPERIREADGGYRYKITIPQAPAQIAEDITVEIYDGEKLVDTFTSSGKDYADTVLSMTPKDAEQYNLTEEQLVKWQTLCRAMVVYADRAKTYFKYDTANPVITEADGSTYDCTLPTEVKGAKFSVNGSDIKAKSLSFMSLSNSALRIYYDGDITEADVSTTKGTRKVNTEKKYIEVSGFAAADLDEVFTVTVKDTTIEANALAYAYYSIGSSNTVLRELCASIVLYNTAANAAFDKTEHR